MDRSGRNPTKRPSLEGAFLIRRLPPWSGNLRKRLRKAPKVFWRDSGALHALALLAGAD